jgi:hypothetical protein
MVCPIKLGLWVIWVRYYYCRKKDWAVRDILSWPGNFLSLCTLDASWSPWNQEKRELTTTSLASKNCFCSTGKRDNFWDSSEKNFGIGGRVWRWSLEELSLRGKGSAKKPPAGSTNLNTITLEKIFLVLFRISFCQNSFCKKFQIKFYLHINPCHVILEVKFYF